MKQKYNVVDFNDQSGVITVQYSDGITINIDLPIESGNYPTGKALDAIVDRMYPDHYRARYETVKRANNADSIKAMIVKPAEVPETPSAPTPIDPQIEIQKLQEQDAMMRLAIREEVIEVLKSYDVKLKG